MVKPGYKQTEIGVLPEDWECVLLLDKSKLLNGLTYTPDNVKNNGLLVLRSSNIQNNQLSLEDTLYVNCIVEDEKKIKDGDIMICVRNGSAALIGKCAQAHRDYDATFGAFMAVLRGNHNDYILQILQQGTIQKEIIKNSGATINQITNGDFKLVKIALPTSNDEEIAIASSLSNVDKLISSLEKLITKKKAIKRGTMQELLTGKRRLPGYCNKWKTDIIPDVLQKQEGIKIGPFGSQLKKEYLLEDGLYKVYGQENVYTQDFSIGNRYLNREKFRQLQSCEVRSGDFLISTMGTIGKCAIVPNGICSGIMDSHLIRLRINEQKLMPEYLLHLFSEELGYLKGQTSKLSVGGIMDGLSTKIVNALNVFYPEDLSEQKAIADFLSSMNTEIQTLEQKLGKYRQIKQGMMQQLLTGKIRLKNDVVDSVHTEQKASAKKSPVRSAHNHHFDDAVSIAAIVDAFYSDKYPLGRVKVQKLLYLLHRHQGVCVSDFKKKAAGPYADTVRYKGGEPIARKNKYIVSESGKQGTRYFRGENMAQALDYVERWGMQADLQWLKDNFLHASRNDLELFATVDMAMCDLDEVGISVSVESIKNLIASNKEWKAKLSKTYFSDWDIARAIKKCTELFN